MDVAVVTSSRWLELSSYQFLLPLLRTHGVDVGRRELTRALPRGVPAYVHHDADLARLQRNMARGLIHTCFVVRRDRIIGAVEIRNLVAHAESCWNENREAFTPTVDRRRRPLVGNHP